MVSPTPHQTNPRVGCRFATIGDRRERALTTLSIRNRMRVASLGGSSDVLRLNLRDDRPVIVRIDPRRCPHSPIPKKIP